MPRAVGVPQGLRAHTSVPKLVSNIPGYVQQDLLGAAGRFAVPTGRGPSTSGYRGRPLPAYLGHGALEKHLIGERFAALAARSGLRLDILGAEADRLYGDDWYRFLANCRCVLGVESGVSAFDLEDEVLSEYTELSAPRARSPWRTFSRCRVGRTGSTTARSARGISRRRPFASARCFSRDAIPG